MWTPGDDKYAYHQNVLHNPAKLRRREIGVERQAGASAHHRLETITFQPGTEICRPIILPDDDRADCLAGARIPGEAAFTLIVDPDAIHLRRSFKTGVDACQQLLRVVLDPAGRGVDLAMLDRMDKLDSCRIDQEGACRCGALIDGERSHFSSRTTLAGPWGKAGIGSRIRRSGRLSIRRLTTSLSPMRSTSRPRTGRFTRSWSRSSAPLPPIICGMTQESASPSMLTGCAGPRCSP